MKSLGEGCYVPRVQTYKLDTLKLQIFTKDHRLIELGVKKSYFINIKECYVKLISNQQNKNSIENFH